MADKAPCRPFVVMVKPVGSRCNLACEYCYYTGVDYSGSRMSDGVLDLFIRQYIEASEGPEVHIVWHGGEPTLAGLDFYRRAVELQKRYLPEGWFCRNNLQTNGVLLDDEWCNFIAEERFDVGLSIDGAEWLHDKYRRDHGGRGSYIKAATAIRRLQDHGVEPDLLCTVTSAAAAEALAVYHALREFNTGWIQFIPIVRRIHSTLGTRGDSEAHVTPESVSAGAYGDFLCAVFDEWARHDIGRLDVQLFAEAARIWSGGAAGLCWMAPTCGRALIVEMDGGVYSCDHFVKGEHRIGDINLESLRGLAEFPEQVRFGDNKRDLLPGSCRACAWLAVCGGGCPKDRFVTEDGEAFGPAAREPPINYLCAGLRQFFAHAYPVYTQIARLARRGLNPAAIMAAVRDGETAATI